MCLLIVGLERGRLVERCGYKGTRLLRSLAGQRNLVASLYQTWLEHNQDNSLAPAIFFNYGVVLGEVRGLEMRRVVECGDRVAWKASVTRPRIVARRSAMNW